mmetsp:Transcript_19042/g.26874  ORF Transcript_19042/g.26874 Transcript_19042/m.26874 type:complete len:250 (-) Transcript_19042:659-1408(-)
MMTHRFRSWLLLVLLPCLLLFPFVRGKPAPYVLSQEQMDTFHRDGVLVIRGLLQGNDLKGAIRTTRRIQRFQGLGQRIMYKLFPNYKLIEFQTWKKHKVLERIAFDSAAPTICARLMGLDNDNDDDNHASQNHPNKNSHHRSLRLLKDAVFGYRAGDEGCGWHVDDKGFLALRGSEYRKKRCWNQCMDHTITCHCCRGWWSCSCTWNTQNVLYQKGTGCHCRERSTHNLSPPSTPTRVSCKDGISQESL